MILRYVKAKADWWTNAAHYNRERIRRGAYAFLPFWFQAIFFLPFIAVPSIRQFVRRIWVV